MNVQNYKLENLLNAIRTIQTREGLDLQTTFKLAHLTKALETSLLAYMETRRDIVKKNTTLDEATGQQKPNDQVALTEALEEIAKIEIDFALADSPLTLAVKKDSGVFTVQLIKAFVEVFGDNFKVEEY